MAECKKNGCVCEDFYKCKTDGEFVESSGKHLDRFCYYCLGTSRIKKIGNKASWSGRTPKWCPRGRGE